MAEPGMSSSSQEAPVQADETFQANRSSTDATLPTADLASTYPAPYSEGLGSDIPQIQVRSASPSHGASISRDASVSQALGGSPTPSSSLLPRAPSADGASKQLQGANEGTAASGRRSTVGFQNTLPLKGSIAALAKDPDVRDNLFVKPLVDLSIKAIADNFEQYPTFGRLPPQFVKRVIALLRLDLPLELVGMLIDDEDYWQQRASVRWKNCDTVAHGGSWKQLYMERNVEAALESYDPSATEIASLERLLTFSSPFVHGLRIRQLPSHIDLGLICDGIGTNLSSLTLTYGMRDVGMDYDRSLFGMRLADCRSLSSALSKSQSLTFLNLSGNGLDDDKVRTLATGLSENSTVTELDISHNKIADRGIRALAKLMDGRSVLARLDVADNQIHAEGGKALARALVSSPCLVSLNLRLNRLGDDGGQAICEALADNSTLTRLSLGSNALAGASATVLAGSLTRNSTLRYLDLTGNGGMGPEGGWLLRDVLLSNTTLQHLDVRVCNFGEDMERSVQDVILSRSLDTCFGGAAQRRNNG